LDWGGSADTSNKFLVGSNGESVVIQFIPHPPALSRADALNLAAWLVAMADPSGEEFDEVLRRVLNT
jgi:hypothetical protein